jgi:hypothetical protein
MDIFDLDIVLEEYITYFGIVSLMKNDCVMGKTQFIYSFLPNVADALISNGLVKEEGDNVILTPKGCLCLLMRQAEICIYDRVCAETPCVW